MASSIRPKTSAWRDICAGPIHWGQSIGPATAEAVTRLLAENRHPEHGYRACLGLLSLAKRYGKVRLESACMLALQIGAC